MSCKATRINVVLLLLIATIYALASSIALAHSIHMEDLLCTLARVAL